MNSILKSFLIRRRSLIIEIICFLFVLLFVYAAISKLMELDKFQAQMGRSPVTTRFSFILMWAVPAFEIVISAMLFLNSARVVGLHASFSLMVAFTAYIIIILSFSENIPCSCGGVLENMGWKQHLVFNLCFVLMAIIAILIYPMKEKNIVAQQEGNAENPKKSRLIY